MFKKLRGMRLTDLLYGLLPLDALLVALLPAGSVEHAFLGAIAGLGILGGALQGIGARRQQKSQNKYYQQAASLYQPEQMQPWMQGMDPNLMAAMGMGGQATGAWGQNLANLAQQPGYIDPKLMNLPMQLSALKQQQDLAAASGKLGKSGMRGGLASSYALANQAGRTMRDVETQQKYALWREQQRRADMAFIQNAYNQLMGQAGQAAGGQANMLARQQAPMPWAGIAGNAIQSGLATFGSFPGAGGGGGGQGMAPSQIPTQTNQWWNAAPQAPMAPSPEWGNIPQGGDFVNQLWGGWQQPGQGPLAPTGRY